MDTVKVAVRIRPMVPSELERGCQESIIRVPGEPQVALNGESFTYNYVFDATDSQEKVFTDAVLPMLDQLLRGFNVTILAYGQTGSGKTHTMGTAFNGLLNEDAGVIPRAMNFIFEQIEKRDEYNVEIKCSFLELYQEQLFDLLTDKARELSSIEIRENKNGTCMPDLTYEAVKTATETTACLMRGSARRAVATTAMNEQSSRSHAIFTVIIRSIRKDDPQAMTTAKFHLVDLAGSERSNKTKTTGDRFKEGVKINHGLLALGNVISALGSEKNAGFVGYRDSKLTRLLQDSLGGNSITLMIACVSPADYNTPETIGTLRYADRARKIKNKPIVNKDPHAAEISNLKSIIQKLRMELLAVKGGSDSLSSGPIASTRQTCNDEMHRDLEEKYKNLQKKIQKTLTDFVENEIRMHIAEAAHEKLKATTDELRIVANELAVDMRTAEIESGAEGGVKVNCEKLKRMVRMITNMNDEFEKTCIEINEHKHQSAMNASRNSDEEGELGEEGGAEIEKEAEHYNNKQLNIREQLTRINNELDLKEQLQQRIEVNLNKFCTLDENMEEKLKDCEMKVRELEDERSQLLDKLQHVKENASAKLAEDRRKRLQTLESELSSLKQKIKQQTNLLKVREKEAQKIQNLSKDIQAMKESKVKLIRTMRREAENFRQWKLTREKELLQMKSKGRKMENEMARKEALHSKQRNVLKRKCEEAMAINKRLKDALERQSAAQSMRQKLNPAKDNNGGRIEQVVAIVERELEVIASLIVAEQSLEHLMEDRGIINRRIADLKTTDVESEELKRLQEEYEMRNAQIAELQQKVCAADLDARIRSLCDSMQNMAEARAVAKQLINTFSDTRREFESVKVTLTSQLQVSEEECQTAMKRFKLLEKEQDAMERNYEEKIALLLGELHSKVTAIKRVPNTDADDDHDDESNRGEPTAAQKECLKIEEDLHSKMESMREEIDYYKELVASLNVEKSRKPKTKALEKLQQAKEVIELFTTEDEDYSDESNDPDWKMTPAPQKRKRSQRTRLMNGSIKSASSDVSGNPDETYVTAASEPIENIGPLRDPPERKSCKCRNLCKTKHCGCRATNLTCDKNCRCGDGCLNGKSSDSKENFVDIIEVESEKTTVAESNFLKPPDLPLSPNANARNLDRLTMINFNTPTSHRKFFRD